MSQPVLENSSKIILASGSPRRVELLQQIGVNCDIYPTDIDEKVKFEEPAKEYVLRLAKEKAHACLEMIKPPLSALPIIAADTTVVFSNRIFGKPESVEDAVAMLKMLSGNTHHVHTSVALAYKNEIDVVVSTTAVTMMPMTQNQIETYIASGEHQGKAGSYGIQGAAATWIKRIDGSYSGVMGLPLYETAMLLRKIGVIT